jgi:2-C-methyl-D-erythritol 4-phosphate cytidylyltransferase
MSTEKYFLIIPAAGIGMRMKSKIPKQYLILENKLSILDQTLQTLLSIKKIKSCIVAINKNDNQFIKSKFYNHHKLSTVIGGKQRFYSVINALNSLKSIANNKDWILVHDAVRPCIKTSEVNKLITQLKNHKTGGILATIATDTIKQKNKNTIKTINRDNIWYAQTPQMYRFDILLKALENAVAKNLKITDESQAIETLGLETELVSASKNNIKITNKEDLKLANFYLK